MDISFQFKPTFAVDYVSKAYLETDLGSFVIDLAGSCIVAKLDSGDDKKDFGTVGVGFAEFRDVMVSNPTSLPMIVRAETDK